MANPLQKIAVAGAATATGIVGNKLLVRGWQAAFGEDAPTQKIVKQHAKETKQERKQAKKEGRSQAEIDQIRDPEQDRPLWKLLLWTLLTTVVIRALQEASKRGADEGTRKLTERRPRPNRG